MNVLAIDIQRDFLDFEITCEIENNNILVPNKLIWVL